MEKLDLLLQDAVPKGEDTTGKVVGAAYIVTDKDGMSDSKLFSPLTNRRAEA